MNPDFTKIDLGAAKDTNRSGKPWASPEGIDVKAAYSPADMQGLKNLNTYPGRAPFIRGPYPTMYAQRPWTCLLYTSPSPRD